jgi:hypothetical protein
MALFYREARHVFSFSMPWSRYFGIYVEHGFGDKVSRRTGIFVQAFGVVSRCRFRRWYARAASLDFASK